MLTFNSIDVEIANENRSSICQIGIAHVQDGEIRDQWKTLINPKDRFDPCKVEIHGIDENAVRHSPTLPQVYDELRHRLSGSILVSHTAFSHAAFELALNKYQLEQIQVVWLDSARIARRVWPKKYGSRGYGLKNIANDFNLKFKHPDALEDAKATAQIVLLACENSGLDIEGWLQQVKKLIFSAPHQYTPLKKTGNKYQRQGNIKGPLYGETIVFSGALSVPRSEAANLATNAGCDVGINVTQKTTMLVIGTQDMIKLNKNKKSSKHRKAEDLILRGQKLQILSETDFWEILK